MRIDLADQHVQLCRTQLPLLGFDLFQQALDIAQHFIIRVSDLIQLCIRMQVDQSVKMASVKFRHRLANNLDRFCKPPGEIDTEDSSQKDDQDIDCRQHEKYRSKPLA